MSNKNRSAEKESFWRLALEEFGKSGLSIRAYCRREGLSEPSFYSWRRVLGRRDAAPGEGDQQSLVPVNAVNPAAILPRGAVPSPFLEVVTPNGFTFRFHRDIDPCRLDALLGVIADSGGEVSC